MSHYDPIADAEETADVTKNVQRMVAEQQGTPTLRTLEAALECAVETARISARNDNGTWFLKVHGTALLNALRELSRSREDCERLREAMQEFVDRCAIGQVRSRYTVKRFMEALAATRKEEGNG